MHVIPTSGYSHIHCIKFTTVSVSASIKLLSHCLPHLCAYVYHVCLPHGRDPVRGLYHADSDDVCDGDGACVCCGVPVEA